MRFFLKDVNIEHKVLWLKSCLSFRIDCCGLRQSDTNFISLLIVFVKDILVTDLFHFFCQWHGSDHPVFQAQAYVKMTDQWIDRNQ